MCRAAFLFLPDRFHQGAFMMTPVQGAGEQACENSGSSG